MSNEKMTSEERADKWWSEHFLLGHGKETIVKMLDAHASEQRGMCAEKAADVLYEAEISIVLIDRVQKACLTATQNIDYE